MPLFEDCMNAYSDVKKTVKRGADNVDRTDIDNEELLDLKFDIDQMRDDSRKLADESLAFAENKQVAMVYAYAHNVKKYGGARCMGQASLAATLLLQKKINCAIGLVSMGGDTNDKHVFVIADANQQLSKIGAEISSLGDVLIVDPWIVLKCESLGEPIQHGVFKPQAFSALMSKVGYAKKLSFVSYIESPFV